MLATSINKSRRLRTAHTVRPLIEAIHVDAGPAAVMRGVEKATGWPPMAIGELERLAGVDGPADRSEFWDRHYQTNAKDMVDAGVGHLKTLIARRVLHGELSLIATSQGRTLRVQAVAA